MDKWLTNQEGKEELIVMLNGEVSAWVLKAEKRPFRRITSKDFPCKFPVFFQSDVIGFEAGSFSERSRPKL